MIFNCKSGNDLLIERLNRSVREKKVSHAYIFEAPLAVDKADFVRNFVKGVLCPKGLGENCGECSLCDKIDHDNHEDIYWVEKDKNSVKDEKIEKVQEKLNVKPIGERNIVIISDSDTMTDRAQNRLLKTLEEPPGQSLIILLSENMENLKQTILSRCVKFRIERGEDGIVTSKGRAVVDMLLSGRPISTIFKEISPYTRDREKAIELLDSMEIALMNLIKEKSRGVSLHKFEELYDAIHEIEKASDRIRQGMTPGYTMNNLIIRIADK